MSTKKWGCLSVVLFLLLCLSGIVILGLIFRGGESVDKYSEEVLIKPVGENKDKIAVISLRGIISSSLSGDVGESMVDDIKIALQQATDDNNVKAIVLSIDSPGGEVTASDVIYNAVLKARAKLPVVIYMNSLAASGGYYVACGGSYLMANETSITGSIGVIIETMNYKSLLDKVGVDTVVFKSGKFKDMLSGSREMTPEEKEYIQKMVMDTYSKFVQIVADARKLPVDGLRNGIADGRVLSGKDALAEKLIDQIGLIEDAVAKARELGHAQGAAVVRYKSSGFSLGKLLRASTDAKQSSRIEVNLTQKILPPLESGRIYLLPSFYAQ